MDDDWKTLSEPHERLKWSRVKAGHGTAKAAADALGMKKDTYSAYEREPGKSKVTGLDHQRAIQFARKFKVGWEWLLTGYGSPDKGVRTEAQERVLTVMSDASDDEQERVARAVEALFGKVVNE